MKKYLLKFNKLISSVILVALVATGYFIFFNKNIQTASAGWWNDSWHYRKSIQITNNASAETNVYASTTIDTSDTTKFQTDCGDLRFTKYTGVELPYYIVSGCGTATTTVHINFETFETGTQTIFYYYGNPTADNGFATSDFSTEASNYTIGTVGSEEVGGGPVGYWSFNEGYGATAHDESSGGNDGTITGAVWKDESECIAGKCLWFDGSDDNVDLGMINEINTMSKNITVLAWLKTDRLSDVQRIFSSARENTNNGFGLGLNSAGLRFTSWDVNDYDLSGFSLLPNTWYYVSFIMNENNDVIFYVNGLNRGAAGSGAGINPNSDDKYYFGATTMNGAGTLTEFFKGYLDEVKIYPYARTADQVKQDYNAGLAGVSSKSGTSASFGSQSDKWMSDGLVGHWKMDETATTSGAIDASGNGNNGTYVGGASTTAGKFGKGGGFDGTDDYVDCGTFETIEGVNALSVSAWIKWSGVADQLTGRANILGKEKAISFRSDDTGHEIFLDLNIGNTWHNSGSSITAIDDGVWHHVVGNYDGEYIRIFVDGVEENRTAYSGAITTSATDYNLSIGNIVNLQHWTGQIDEVRVYNRALSQDEVIKLYEYAPGPVLHLKMDEKVSGDAKTLNDISGNGNNGTTVDGANNTGMDCAVTGKYGSACEFDGVDDYVGITQSSSLNNLTSFTYSVWVKAEEDSNSQNPIIEKGLGSSKQRSMTINESSGGSLGMIAFLVDTDATDAESRSVGGTYTVGQWEHWTATYEDSGDRKIRIYKNGQEVVYSTQTAGTGNLVDDAANDIALGASVGTQFYVFTGQIDDVRIYDYARTQKQILADYAGEASSRQGGLGGSVLDLDFDEGFGATAHNKGIGGASLNGTLTPGAGGTNTSTTQMWSLSGKNGKAMEFDGTDDYVSVPNFGY